MCRFGTTEVAASFLSESKIVCSSSPNSDSASATTPLAITNNGVDYGESVTYNYKDDIEIASIHPKRGSKDGGTIVTVNGSNFVESEDLQCFFGPKASTPASPATYISSTQITCVTPQSVSTTTATATASLYITNNLADFTLSPIKFHYISNPFVLSVSPLSGPVEGSTNIVLNGFNFIDGSSLSCRFGESESGTVGARFISSIQIECDSPPEENNVVRSVAVYTSMNGADYTDTTKQFSYNLQPVVGSFAPLFGPSVGGTSVTISGENFEFTKDLVCRFGTVNVKASYISESSIVCVTPTFTTVSVSPQTVISVSNNGVNYYSSIDQFEFVTSAAVVSISPISGPIEGGTAITITGTGFEDTNQIHCMFKSSTSSEIVEGDFLSATSIKCVSPACESCIISTFSSVEVSTNEVS